MLKPVVLAAALLASANAAADVVGVHLVSQHFPNRDFNNVNPGLFWRGDAGYQVGVYRNSERRVSFYGGRVFSFMEDRVHVAVGAATGYQATPVMPIVVPSVAVGAGFRLHLIPAPPKSSPAIHLTYEFNL